mmetsp:Transcript_17226/g.26609  ORF Transcript_17226/g.26609 Transcript_17226/m.26609 type:complete len:109 (+) Transcript_17226:89-415(+)
MSHGGSFDCKKQSLHIARPFRDMVPHQSLVSDFIMPLSHFGRLDADKVTVEKEEDPFEVGGRNLWILKPVGLNRGQGIHVVDSFKKVKKLIKEYCLGKEVILGGNPGS